MLEVFDEEVDLLIKDGIVNLYWFRDKMQQIWLRAGVPSEVCAVFFKAKNENGTLLTKRQMMERLYEKRTKLSESKRLEISRNFARILMEHRNFVQEKEGHKVSVAEDAAKRLHQIRGEQEKATQYRIEIQQRAINASRETYESKMLDLRDRFMKASSLEGQERGYEFEKLFLELMKISAIPVEEPFKIKGEQIDGAIKYGNRFYLIELKWVKSKCNQADVASLYLKAEGKMDTRGIFIAMEGFSSECLESLPRGKQLTTFLLDGVHISNVIFGTYTFQELLEHALSHASLKGEIYCPHQLG